MKPILVKFGVVLALSFAGFLYSRIRTRRIKPSNPPASPPRSISDSDRKVDNDGGLRLKYDPLSEMDSVDASDKPCIRVRVDSSSMHASPNNGRYSGDRACGYLLQEFPHKAFDVENLSETDLDSSATKNDLAKSLRKIERDDYEQEIESLKKRIRFLVERERKLEVQLLEYYGLKEQETAMVELQNRLKIHSVEGKLFLLKIDNLKSENKRLEAQVADHTKVVTELEAAKMKIKLLKKKIRYEAELNKEQILDLSQRVAKLQEQEQEHEHEINTNLSNDLSEIQRVFELETEAEELRKCNTFLLQENADLAQRLDSTQILANTLFEDPEREELNNAMFQLNEENKKLKEETDRLQADRCADAKELVYLRWMNACLRFELRNYVPPPGKIVARDLSKCLSPTSEKKAKQLILEYSITENEGDREPPSALDFDFDNWPSSQPSYLTDSTDHDASPGPSSTNKPRSKRIKFFSILRKLVRGISSSHQHHHNQDTKTSPMCRSLSVDDIGKRYFEEGPYGSRSNPQSPKLASSSQNSNISSLENQPLASLAEEDENPSRRSNSRSSSHGGVMHLLGRESTEGSSPFDYTPERVSSDYGQKSELAKYAEVLRDNRMSQKHKKSASFDVG